MTSEVGLKARRNLAFVAGKTPRCPSCLFISLGILRDVNCGRYKYAENPVSPGVQIGMKDPSAFSPCRGIHGLMEEP